MVKVYINNIIVALVLVSILTGCEGSFGWVYDDPSEEKTIQGQCYVDASDWKKWYYLDIPKATEAVKQDSTHDVSKDFVAYDIPLAATGATETERGEHQRDGQYMYYFDVFNEGISKNHFSRFTPTAAQSAPETWTIALHRNNVRTNGCGVYETGLTDMNAITHEMCLAVPSWTQDEWSENVVWDDQSTMLSCYVPSQGINVNKVLSSWLSMEIPPVPPVFNMNSHVMLLRLPDGTYAALQLVDYMSSEGKKCCLTIKYRYPL